MVDLQTVCSMCGDVGFPDKLFRCSKCHHRFQHSYCSNYYSESSEAIQMCDWCQSEGASSRNGARKLISDNLGMVNRSENSGDNKIKQNDDKEEESGTTERAKMNPNGSPSPRTATRRYKLLKDVMC
ncbi:hypothetical protein KY290_025941 [Solanum tuberosum]|uniref:PHD-type zinc finger plants domain-containing protein n=3 Tax=Solanum tuberosum TaxID=4113 RepID=A0ABQ7UV10_SOLTU|nr:PREDICTED: uncharacterized protein LOC102590250 [Solanum tuberosum]KAH0670526.1 hypothetical protein KY289_025019 [Solanum tuberosum]KAH0673670.1 hypothetical protein KY284_024757 [Solanum tuberosum]KAH0677003.1 hypothetical protein KY285_024804 [Solanum tuberosum]KAH0755671.1 hypothetical protein KY290_025941 [Solanum tuberosum]